MVRSLYSAQQVANMLGISKQTIYRYEKKRIFPRPRRNPINKRREYTPDDLSKLKRILGRS